MERDSRRNSILKPACWNQASVFEYEEEQTESLTISRQKSLKKRVSFSGKNEVKEFQKHEVLTIEKLEKALIKLKQDESQQLNNSTNTKSEWDWEKENIQQHSKTKTEMLIESNDNMEITTMVIGSNSGNENSELQDCAAQEIEMELSTCSTVHISNISAVAHQHVSSDEMETTDLPSIAVEDSAVSNSGQIHEISDVDMSLGQETMCSLPNEMIEALQTFDEVKTEKETTGVNSTYCAMEVLEKTKSSELAVVENHSLQEFHTDQTSEFYQLAQKFGWTIKLQDNELLLSKVEDYLVLKLKLDFEYCYQNVSHYVIEDIEIDTKKDVEDKWARFGFSVLENTLEHCNLLGVCSNTRDLPKLMHAVEEHVRTFLEFVIDDSTKFELLANPRSIKFDTDYSKLTFELSNLENLFWIRITLSLNTLFPLTAQDVMIENILGNFNKAELINMISTIRPCGLYLTRVAECIEDFLKFRPNERKILDVTCDGK